MAPDAPRAAPVGEQQVHVPDDLDVEPRPVRACSGGGRDGGDKPPPGLELFCAHLEQSLPLPLRGDAPGASLVLVHVVRVAGEDRAARGQAGGVGDPVHGRPGHREVHRASRKGGRLVERDSGHGDDRGGRRVAIERAPTGLAVGLRPGVMGARARVGDPGARLGRRRDDDYHALVRRRAEGVPQVGGGDPPRVRREINERVDQLPASALRHEIADEAVRVHAGRRPDRPRRARARSPTAPRRPSRPGGSPRRKRAARGRAARSRPPCSTARGDVTAWCFPLAQRRRGPDARGLSSHRAGVPDGVWKDDMRDAQKLAPAPLNGR